MAQHYGTAGGGGGGVSPRKSVVQSACQEETDKNFDLIMEILFRFLGFGDFPIVIEN